MSVQNNKSKLPTYLKERDHLEDLSVDARIVLIWTVWKKSGRGRML
jgi:hypothetical protein